MKKTLIQEIGYEKKKELLPVIFSHTEPMDIKKIKRDRPYRMVDTTIHQSEIYCLRIYKDGINISTE
ncbi:hypothetical protein [Chryseobacterium lathyri]|uniref:Uncharacterized protein n=1 Tax=Chryseobacterium lathyri TaxID=395933 RepID=A0ABT9SFC6_9FLAO|nr:hypothetical protein [Chryseobacterium lathyri]MDP9958143.1 hypothetical protein [Chryseobacterium lathyri]MDQ0066167.1 hypothetical protein [Chryseobacterium lathyri]